MKLRALALRWVSVLSLVGLAACAQPASEPIGTRSDDMEYSVAPPTAEIMNEAAPPSACDTGEGDGIGGTGCAVE